MALVRQRPSIGALERAIVWTAAASPILIGACMFLSIDAAALISGVLSDATLERTPAYTSALRATGSYVFVFGCLLAAATRDLPQHASLITVAAALFAGRSLQRAVYASTLENAYTVDPTRNALNVAYLAAVAAALLWVRLRVRRRRDLPRRTRRTRRFNPVLLLLCGLCRLRVHRVLILRVPRVLR